MTSSLALIKKINKTLNKKGLGLSKVDKNTVSIGIVDVTLLGDADTKYFLYCYRKNMEGATKLTESLFY